MGNFYGIPMMKINKPWLMADRIHQHSSTMMIFKKNTVITIFAFVPPFCSFQTTDFQPWTGLGATVLLGVLWNFSAAHLHSPRMMCLVRDANNATWRDSFCSSFNLQNQSDLAAWDHTDMENVFHAFPKIVSSVNGWFSIAMLEAHRTISA